MVASNVEIPGGEVDLVADDNGARVVVEVRTTTGPGDPIDAVTYEKRRRVRSLASRLGATRVDFIGVLLSEDSVEVHWVPG